MSNPENSNRILCPECGLPLPERSPAGLCPTCLLRVAMGEPASEISEQALQGHDTTIVSMVDRDGGYPKPGTTIRYFGDYELHEEIARGGMGVVYRARQVRLNRHVALKMIRAGKFSSETEIQRLRVEAEAAAQLDHPAIVPVFEVGEFEGLHYFTMAFVNGQPLSAKLNQGPLPAQVAAKLMQIVAQAVAYAHEKGVIHRDIKPGNILIDQAGLPRVSDFGLAKQIENDHELTTTGQILGTPSYMPPEQAEGILDQIGPVSDIYSLGAVLYATLTGRPPFQAATSVETLRQVIDQQPVAPRRLNSSIPRDLETICLKCLEKKTLFRYASATALAEDLGRFLEGRPITARRTSIPERCWRWACRRPDLSLTLLALGILISVAIVGVTIQQHRYAQFQLQSQVEGQVRTIETADFRQLPSLIADLKSMIDPMSALDELRKRADTAKDEKSLLRLKLATAVLSGELESATLESWWTLSLQELAVVRQTTQPLRPQFLPQLQKLLTSEPPNPELRQKQLRAMGLMLTGPDSRNAITDSASPPVTQLQSMIPSPDSQQILWDGLAETLLQVIYDNPGEFDSAVELFQPASIDLFNALKRRIETQNVSQQQNHIAMTLMRDLVRDSPSMVADLACMVDRDSLSVIRNHVDRMGADLVPAFQTELSRPEIEASKPDEALPLNTQKKLAAELVLRRAKDVRRRAMAAAWLYRLGMVNDVWPLLKEKPDDSLRHAMIDQIRMVGGPVEPLIQQLEVASNQTTVVPESYVSGRNSEVSMLVLLIGELSESMADDVRKNAIGHVGALFENHPAPGVHSACEWTLNQLAARPRIQEIQNRLSSAALSDQRDWYVTSTGATMAVIRGPVTFQMGADWTDPNRLANDSVDAVTGIVTQSDEERYMTREIGRDFAIGLKEVSLAEFIQFDPDFHSRINQFMSPTLDHPANKVNWYLAARYCNWLSRKEGLDDSELCFIPDVNGQYGEGLMLAENYLQRRGYRMPTEAEWEYVCRAGTTTPRFFGHCIELMPQYVWYAENSNEQALIIPGTLKPNDLGLFDIFGNVLEWCIDPYKGRPAASNDVVPDSERELTADAEGWRVLRGGNLYAEESSVRATDLWTFRPITSDGHYGLRLARTLKTYDGR
ncbi:MAG: protein kinase [Planctomyces sp.]|nr:protein kinase [Planctomyces sp.]